MIGYQDNFCDEIIVDNFAGGGGTSTGIELALGRIVDAAINHDPAALMMHFANHQWTQHYNEDVWHIDPREVAQGRRVALCWFSPDCKHFSRAKGAVPVSKKIRGLAWVACRWAGTVKPRVIILENVPEFVSWGPVKDGKPIKEQAGKTFRSFVHELEVRGYMVEWRVLKACDFGAPTSRKRFYLIARSDGQPIVWPEPTHGPGLKPHHTAAECIDWSIPCPSIFDRKTPLKPNTMRRIARGTDKFVITNCKPYIVQVNHGGDSFCGQSSTEPLQTNTANLGYGLDKPTLAPYIMQNNTNNVPSKVQDPISTITTGNRLYAIAPSLTKFQQNSIGQNVTAPMDTVMPGATQFGATATFLTQYHSEQNDAQNRAYTATEPIKTIDGSNRYGLAAVHIDKYFGGEKQAGSSANHPLGTVTVIDHNALAATYLAQYNGGAESTVQVADIVGRSETATTYRVKYPAGTKLGRWPEIRSMLNQFCGYSLADDELIILTIRGVSYFITDIGLRMLTPRELFLAQGFPPDYIIDIEKAIGKKYSKAKQVARCGNSVSPPVAAALVRANLAELAVKKAILTMAALRTTLTRRRRA